MPYADPFVTEVAPDAESVVYSTYLDYAYVVTGIAVLSNGNVFVVGNDAGPSYPTTASAYESNSGSDPAFLTELNSSGSGLVYSTVIGDSSYTVNGMALDADGNIWLAAQTSNPQFPLVAPIQGTFPTSGPASLVNEFDPTGQTLMFSTFLGGNAPGYASSVAVDANDRVHVAGAAEYGMYTTPGVYAGSVPTPGSAYSESTYAYVALIDPATASGTLCLGGSASEGLSFGYLVPQTTESQNVQVTNCGSGPLTISSIASSNAAFTVPTGSNGCTGSLAAGGSCTVSVEFAPTAVQTYSGTLTFTSNASVSTASIPLSGSGGEPAAGFGPPGVTQTLIFPPELVGQSSPAEIIALYNNGTVPLTIYLSQITVSSGFALAPGGTCTSSLAAGQSCWIFVEFAPETAGTFKGTLSVSSNDPVNPTISTSLMGTAYASYPIATITALFNPSYPIGGTSPITMTVEGSNFFPASVVYINGAAQATTYENGTFLSVTFPSSLLNAAGEFPVTVVNPAPGGGSSASYPLIGYLSIPLTASALTVDPVGGLLYAAIPASASQNPNTVIPINPATGATMTPIAVASGPVALAVSDDGSELYVASAGVLQRFNLQTLALERTFNLPVDPEWGQTYVQEMHVVPGSPQSIVVELFANVDPAEDGAALYNDSGLVSWIPGVGADGSPSSPPLEMDSFSFTSSSMIYGLPEPEVGTFFLEVPVSPSGLSYTGTTVGEANVPLSSIVRSDGTLLYTNSGEVWNPSTMTLLGTYLEPSGDQIFYSPGVIPDTANGDTDFLDSDAGYSEYQAVTIDVYDQANYALLGTVPFTSIYPPDVTDLVRWGSNGFAFRCVDITGEEPSANQIVIVTSSLVTQSNGAPVPIVSSVSPATVYSGGPAFTLQVTGSGFTSASTVLINGNLRTTTYVSGTSLTAQVLATDIVQNGQLNVQVTTPAPGGGTSNDVVVSIEAPPQTTPTVTVTPSATSITTAQALTVMVAVTGSTGSPAATGTVKLTSGSYASAATTLSRGSATINIQAGSLAVGSDTLTASYTPDSTSSATFNSATGTSPAVTVTQATQTISFTQPASSVTYGVKPIALSATASSKLAVVFSVASGPVKVSGTNGATLTITGAGTVVVAAKQAGNADYLAAPELTRTITVNKAAQTISFIHPASPVTYSVKPIALSAKASSKLAVTFSIVSGPAKVSDTNDATLTITGAGTVVVTAKQ
ncbi:MAG: choice-of-anchor D domain-containing protein, partial [Terracidiphilus sp.]